MKITRCTLGELLLCVVSLVSRTLAQDLCLAGSFEQQTNALLNYIRLPEETFNQLPQVTNDVERVLESRWPGCKVKRFGSTVTGLALKSSDVDCHVYVPGGQKDSKTLVAETLDIFKNYPDLFQHCETKPTAPVPLLTCVHIPTNLFLDLTFDNDRVINISLLVSYFLHLDKRVLDLATIIKYWGSVHNIANGKQTLPSYAMVLMTVFYLQQKNILPPVTVLQQNVESHEHEHWNIAFQPIEYHTENNETLYELLGGFFEYYSDFDFENTIISPYVGYPIKRTQFLDFDNLKGFSLYKSNVANGLVEPFTFGYLNIQEPVSHNQNTGQSYVYNGKWLADRLIKQVRAVARIYKILSSEEILTALLVPDTRIEAGKLKTFWSGGVGSEDYCKHKLKIT